MWSDVRGHTGPMDVTADLDTPFGVEPVFDWVEDLARYPAWLEIVTRAEPVAAVDGDPGPAWAVDLRGRLGPLARSKRLRMVRSTHQHPDRVVFERRETDTRSHAPWILRAEVVAAGAGSRLTMQLHYGGGLWGPVLERLLGDEIEQSRARLLTCIETG